MHYLRVRKRCICVHVGLGSSVNVHICTVCGSNPQSITYGDIVTLKRAIAGDVPTLLMHALYHDLVTHYRRSRVRVTCYCLNANDHSHWRVKIQGSAERFHELQSVLQVCVLVHVHACLLCVCLSSYVCVCVCACIFACFDLPPDVDVCECGPSCALSNLHSQANNLFACSILLPELFSRSGMIDWLEVFGWAHKGASIIRQICIQFCHPS